MSHSSVSPRGKKQSPRRRAILISLLGLGLLMASVITWVGVRGLVAQDELTNAVALSTKIRAAIVGGDTATAERLTSQLITQTATARDLTDDPIWRGFELIPGLGPNFSSTRKIAAVVDDVAEHAVYPLVTTAGGVRLADLRPVNGAIDFQPLLAVQPRIAEVKNVLLSAQRDTRAIDARSSIGAIQKASAQLASTIGAAVVAVESIDRAARILPAMLGANGPRNYLILFQTPAELRATGGIAGALALVHTENGHLTLTAQATSGDFPHHPEPVLPLSAETTALYGDITGEFIQDVSLTPNFARSAELAREMWRLRFGVSVDGVITADPVALSYLLTATGPIPLVSGEKLTSSNVVQLLYSDVYQRFVHPADQDRFFASAAAAVFAELAKGKMEPKSLVAALTRSGSERRILLWSAHPEDQAVLADTTLAGGLPISDAVTKRFGVYFNDATGAKMDRYLKISVGVGQLVCRSDRRAEFRVMVSMKNTLPTNAVDSLPAYVSGGVHFGVPVGSVKTNISVYGAKGTQSLGVSHNGENVGYQAATDDGYVVSAIGVQLAPQEATELIFSWLNDAPFSGQILSEGNPVFISNLLVNRGSKCI